MVLGWATIAMFLFYFAWRYNVFFVTDTSIDTRGLIYPRAIKQLFTGLYLGEVCMIGIFGASVAIGPLVLTFILLVFTVLFHISLNSALNPLLYNIPLSLMAEEESARLLDVENAAVPSGSNDKSIGDLNGDGVLDHTEKSVADARAAKKAAAIHNKGNFLTRFLKPWVYSDYASLRNLVPRGVYLDPYPEEVIAKAYDPPSVTSDTPLLWIPSDPAGVSKQEVAHTSKVIPITDEGCELDANGKLVWDQEGTRPPIWEEKILY